MTKLKKDSTVVVRAEATLWSPITESEYKEWLDSPASKGMTCDGETKIAPSHTYRRVRDGRTYRVVRARTRAPRGFSMVPGCATLVDEHGRTWFAEREDIHPLD